MSREFVGPFDLVPTEDLAERALDLLKSGEVVGEFTETAHYLTLLTQEPQAMVEGTLLIVGAELEEIAQASIDPKGDPAVEHLSRDRRLFAFLQFAEGYFSADESRRLRPIGRRILDHCLLLSTDNGVTDILKSIGDSDTHR